MDVLATTDARPASPHHSRGEETSAGSRLQDFPPIAFPVRGPVADSSADVADFSHEAVSEFDTDDLSRLLKSFDMVFQLHQRSEEIRIHLSKIDEILMKSRTVAGLIERVTQYLERDLDLAAARVFIRGDNAVSSVISRMAPFGGGIIPNCFPAYEGGTTDPFILDDPSGDLSFTFFGGCTSVIGSAAIAYLSPDDDKLGLLCLGSSDPRRYCGDMNTDLIAGLAEKIGLGIKNAWDHENAVRRMLKGHAQGVFSEAFFMDYLQKEFQRTWRNRRPFSLAAMSWSSPEGCPASKEITELVSANIRSSDIVAQGDTVSLWALLPDTDAETAKNMAQRIAATADERFHGDPSLHVGITEFSKEAAVLSTLIDQAKAALRKAEENDQRIVVEIC
jgi:uncharacterized protein YigA (DUF484 family)